MTGIVSFIIEIEVNEENKNDISMGDINTVLSNMEELCALRDWPIHDQRIEIDKD